jgi:hypothetical protein
LYYIYAVGRPEIRKEIGVVSFDVDTITFWYERRSAFGDTVIPVMVIVTVADPLVNETPPVIVIVKDMSDAISNWVLVTEVVIALLANVAFDALLGVVNTSEGNFMLTVSTFATNACEIFIVIIKVPVVEGETGFVHTAELPWEDNGAHRPLPASHVVPVSQHPGP